MVVTRSGEDTSLGGTTRNVEKGTSGRVDDEDGVVIDSVTMDKLNLNEVEDGGGEDAPITSPVDAEEEDAVDDIDFETLQNTRINEYMCIAPRRMLRRKASSRLNTNTNSNTNSSNNQNRDSNSSEDETTPPKHVEFADDPRPIRVLENHKAALENPRTPEERKERAREILEFHGESCA